MLLILGTKFRYYVALLFMSVFISFILFVISFTLLFYYYLLLESFVSVLVDGLSLEFER